MLSNMKTTIDLPDALYHEVKSLAQKRNASLKEIIYQALQIFMKQAQGKKSTRFKLKRASVKGNGLQERCSELSWEQIRELSYQRESQ